MPNRCRYLNDRGTLAVWCKRPVPRRQNKLILAKLHNHLPDLAQGSGRKCSGTIEWMQHKNKRTLILQHLKLQFSHALRFASSGPGRHFPNIARTAARLRPGVCLAMASKRRVASVGHDKAPQRSCALYCASRVAGIERAPWLPREIFQSRR